VTQIGRWRLISLSNMDASDPRIDSVLMATSCFTQYTPSYPESQRVKTAPFVPNGVHHWSR
jgi:hypothetical protein